jgi:hypothetical protein
MEVDRLHPEASTGEVMHALSSRALVIALVIGTIFAYLMSEWVRLGELISYSTQVSESVPPITSVAALAFLLGINPLLRKVSQRLALSRGQILVIYVFTMVSVAMASCGVVRIFFPFLTAMQYFAGSTPAYRDYLQYLDPRFFPKGENVIQAFYEGAENEKVPWEAWAVPMLLWTAFFVVLFLTMLCLLTIFRKQWVEKERLSFPLVQFALEITEQGVQKRGATTFFRNPLMWVGFMMAALFEVTNILSSFDPAVPHMGRDFTIAIPDPPWKALSATLAFRPTIFGLAYLVPLDVSLSVWVSHFLMKFEAFFALVLGKQNPGIPYDYHQSWGAYLALLCSLIWVARPHLKSVFRKAFRGDASVDDSQEVMSYRLAVFGGLAGFIFLVVFASVMGLGPLPAALLFLIVLGFGLVYSKLRAEAGTPLMWTFPFITQKEILVYSVGSKHYSKQSLTVLSVFRFLTRGYFTSTCAYQVDGMKMAPEGRVKQRQMGAVLLVAVLVGLATAYWVHLGAYYKYGCNVLETDDPSAGGYRVTLATQEYNELVSLGGSPTGPDMDKNGWTAVGFIFTSALIMLRKSFFKFPLHPMGFALAATFGSTLWGSFFFAWLIKFFALRMGGLRLYERLTPWALGVVFGEFFTSGLWSFMGLINTEWGPRWIIFFG